MGGALGGRGGALGEEKGEKFNGLGIIVDVYITEWLSSYKFTNNCL